MDRFMAMQVFTRIVELGAFGKAADSLNLPRASVTTLIKQLERHLDVQLLQRTTRQVKPTLDGSAYYQRCLRLLADLEETESVFSTARLNPQGRLRVDIPASIGRLWVIPALPQFCARYPRIELEVGCSDRPVELIREGVDCVVRGGDPHDVSLVARPLAQLEQVTCVSSDYLRRHGAPEHLDALAGHVAVDFFSSSSGRRFELEFLLDGIRLMRRLPSSLSVNSADAYVAACEAGMGLIQVPRYHVVSQLAAGTLVEVLPGCRPLPLPLTALYPAHRQLSRRVRVFVDWLVELFAIPPH
ncbi:MAG: LysR family transcriptional regulator [Pseudomonadota bacterium]